MPVVEAYLRPLRRDDAPAVLAAFGSSADMSRQGDVRDLPSAEAYVARLVDPAAGHRAWAVARPDDSLAGVVAVSVDEANRSGWFWYWLNAADRGQGWVTRAAISVASWALHDLGLHRLELGHRANNPASGAVARAAGFVQEGVEREKFLVEGQRIDVLTYGRLSSDPAPTGHGLRLVGSPPGA